jgi:hypothetical protein
LLLGGLEGLIKTSFGLNNSGRLGLNHDVSTCRRSRKASTGSVSKQHFTFPPIKLSFVVSLAVAMGHLQRLIQYQESFFVLMRHG